MPSVNPEHDIDAQIDLRVSPVRDLMADLRRGKIRMPVLSRGMKWNRIDALRLFDSLYRGYPIGSLLFWQAPAAAGFQQLGSLRIASAQRHDAWWAVGGQQRLAALARVLLPDEEDQDDFALFFDLDLEEVVEEIPAEAITDLGRWLPMTEVLDPERQSTWMTRFNPEHPDRAPAARHLGNRIRGYAVPAYVVRADTEQPVMEMYRRISSAGHPLGESEVGDALLGIRGARWGTSIDAIASELEEFGFGRIGNRLLRALLDIVRGKSGPIRGVRTAWYAGDDGTEADYRGLQALTASVIVFLQQDAGIPRIELLPHRNSIIALGQFFDAYPEPEARTRNLLARWFWRAAMTSDGALPSSRQTGSEWGDSRSEHRAVHELLSTTTQHPIPEFERALFDLRSRESKLAISALLDLKPRHLSTERQLQAADLICPNGRMRLPKCFPGFPTPAADTLLNRIAHPLATHLKARLGQHHARRVLDSHGISVAAQQALQRDDAASFFTLRAVELRRQFEAFFARKTRWGESDRPPLSALMIGEDEEQ